MSRLLPYLPLLTTRPNTVVSTALLVGLLLAVALVLTYWRYRRTAHRLTMLHGELTALRRAVLRDPLTGLANRAGLADAWRRLAPAHPWVMMVDLDEFKPVNDNHGHAAGDLVLTVIADRLRTLPGAVARLGGDEFAALLTTGNPTAVAGRLAAAIAAPVTLPSGAQVSVTASIGLTPTKGDLSAALADADAAMYRAKTTRTNVVMFDPRRDDHPNPAAGTRPVVRVRDLARITINTYAH